MGRLERLSASVMTRVGRWESVFVSSPPLSFACSAHPRCVAPIFLGQDLGSLFRMKLAGCHLVMMAASGLRLEVKASKQNGDGGETGRAATIPRALHCCSARQWVRSNQSCPAQPSRGTK